MAKRKTIKELPGFYLADRVGRETDGITCPLCNGYADQVDSTKDEINSELNCDRSYACCCRAFVCRLCKTRIIAHAEAPECNW